MADSLDDEKINKILANIKGKESERLVKVFQTFSNKIAALITLCSRTVKKEYDIIQIERIKRIIRLCPLEEKLLRCKDKIFTVRDHIINRNADYFLNRDYSNYIKEDEKKEFINDIIDLIKRNYSQLKKEEQELYWPIGLELLKCVIEFMQITGEHSG